MKTSAEARNFSIDCGRLAGAMLIVVLHTGLFSGENPFLDTVAARCLMCLPRIAVPFFLCLSGYYYIDGLLSRKKLFKRRFLQYFTTYAVWSLIYSAAAFLYLVPTGKRSPGKFFIERIVYFFTLGGYTHLWYMLALIYAMCVAALFYNMLGKRGLAILAFFGIPLFAAGCLGSAYYELGVKIPVLSAVFRAPYFENVSRIVCLGIPLFMSGYFVRALEIVNKKAVKILLCLSAAFFILEIFIFAFSPRMPARTEIFLSLYPLAVLALRMMLTAPIMPSKYMKALSLFLRGFSGFLYFVHPLVMEGLLFAFGATGESLSPSLLLALTLLLSAASWLVCKLYGGRATNILAGISR